MAAIPIPSRFKVALCLYVVLVTLVFVTRPALMFDNQGRPKRWGAQISEHVSIFAPAFALPLLGLLSYYIATALELAVGLA